MSGDGLNIVANVVATVAYAVALIGVLAMPARPGGFMRNGIKFLIAGAMAINVFVGFSHILQFGGVTDALDIYENYLKVLVIPLLAVAAYTVRMNEQLRVIERQQRVASAEHDMLMRIVDTTPTGLLVVDAEGRIEFANDRAKDMLDIAEDPQTGAPMAATWTCEDANAPGMLSCCVKDGAVRDGRCALRWPDGVTRVIAINATPIATADGGSVGAVVAFTMEAAVATA